MFYIYGFLSLMHIVAQIIFGHGDFRRQRKENRVDWSFMPSVGVIVPVYNEDEDRLKRSLDSIRWQTYTGIFKVFVVDDGSKNAGKVERVYRYFEEKYPGMFFILRKRNEGKRMSQFRANDMMIRHGFKPEVVVTIDSDTILDPGALSQIVQSFKDETVGAATGHVLALNKGENLLTKLINYRYWMAFNQERAAQSFFRVLMCCSGPFSAYRGNLFRGLMHRYTTQTFFGKVCTYGDDRHLTNLVLEEGWNVVYNKDAEALTHVPNNLREYLRQQLRWNKSFYREMLWTMKAVTKHNAYLIYDLAMQFILPFLLIGALMHTAYVAAFVDGSIVFAYIGIMLGVSLLRVTYGLIRTKDLGFYWFLIYGLFHVLVLIPTRFVALATLNDGKWGTRG